MNHGSVIHFCVNYVVVSPEALNFLARLGWELSPSSGLIHVSTLGGQRSQRPVAMGKRAGSSVAISSTVDASASRNVRDILSSDRGVPRSKSSRILHSSWSAPLSPSTLTSRSPSRRSPSRRSPSSARTPLAHRCPPCVVGGASSPSC